MLFAEEQIKRLPGALVITRCGDRLELPQHLHLSLRADHIALRDPLDDRIWAYANTRPSATSESPDITEVLRWGQVSADIAEVLRWGQARPAPMTREEALKQIESLRAYVEAMPKDNHPETIEMGMLFKDNRNGSVYMVVHLAAGKCLCKVKATGFWSREGSFVDHESLFGEHPPETFTYLGHAKDLITIRDTI